jgi:hypothetical protein
MSRAVRPTIRFEKLEDRSLPSFVAAPSFPVGLKGGGHSNPQAIVTGDFNRDGLLDVATANKGGPFDSSGTDGVSILLGAGNGAFKPARNMYIGHIPVELIATDVNGDGKLDLVTANQKDNSVTVLIGSGTGGFAIGGTFSAGSKPVALAADDLNGDGHKDLAVADNGSSSVTILLGDGTGKFTAGGGVAVGSQPTSVAIGDFNNDTHPDIASVSGGFGHLNVNLNNGNGTLGSPVNYATGFCANTVVVGYFNNDAQPDLAVACVFPSNDGVSILLGNSNGTFQPFASYDAGGQTPKTLAVGDFDGDGKQDIITANDQFANNSVSVLLGDGNGAFGEASVFTAGQGPMDVAVGDFNRDGLLDAVTADTGTPVGSGGGPVGTVSMLIGSGDGTFVASPDLVLEQPGAIVAGNFTADSIPDLAIITGGVSYHGVAIFPGLGDGTFGPKLLTPMINQPTGVAFGDLNGDSKNDLAVSTNSGVTVFLGNGDGTFGNRQDYAITGNPSWLTLGNFDGGSALDLAVTTKNGVSVLLGNGDGTFGLPAAIAAGGESDYVTSSDFNGDGKADLAVVNESANTVSLLFGAGNGSFTLSIPSYSTRVGPGSVAVGNFNSDGKPDLAIPTFFGIEARSALAILVNGVNGRFTQKVEYATDSRPIGSVVADWNGDNRADLALANNFADNVFVFGGSGTGTFGTPASYVVGDRPTWLASADFNGDGKPDLAVVNSNSGTITLLETALPVASFHVKPLADSTTAGKAVQVLITPVNAAGHLVPGFTGAVSLTSSDPQFRQVSHTFTAKDHGAYAYKVTLKTAGNQDIVAHYGNGTGLGSLQVNAAAARRLGVIAPLNPIAGTPFDLKISALDRYGNPDPTFAGTVHLVATDKALGISLPSDYTFVPADLGTHTFAGGVTLLTAARQRIYATTIGAAIAGRATMYVTAGALAGFKIIGLPAIVTSNYARSITVIAQDAFGNTITNYAGTVQFTNSGGNALLPTAYTFVPTDMGKHVFKVTFQTPGVGQSLTVSDQSDSNISGSVTGITVA